MHVLAIAPPPPLPKTTPPTFPRASATIDENLMFAMLFAPCGSIP
jgi:hypothetical protein